MRISDHPLRTSRSGAFQHILCLVMSLGMELDGFLTQEVGEKQGPWWFRVGDEMLPSYMDVIWAL